jgi:hypothetical protein
MPFRQYLGHPNGAELMVKPTTTLMESRVGFLRIEVEELCSPGFLKPGRIGISMKIKKNLVGFLAVGDNGASSHRIKWLLKNRPRF